MQLTPDYICDLITTAVEGGIGYWCESFHTFGLDGLPASYQTPDTFASDWHVRLRTDDGEEASFNQDDFARAIDKLPPHHLVDIFDNNHDAETADCLVQIAAFGDIIYG